jgi:hypothetical protein
MSKESDSVAHRWASQQKDYGKSGNIHFQSGVIYSYGWWPMAKWHYGLDGTPYIIMAVWTYSRGTSKHMGAVRGAIPNDVKVYYSNEVETQYYSYKRSPVLSPKAVIKTMLEDMAKSYEEFFNKRSYVSGRSVLPEDRMRYSTHAHSRAKEFCKLTGLAWDEDFDKYLISQSEADLMNRMIASVIEAREERERVQREYDLLVESELRIAMSKYLIDPMEAAKRWMRGEYTRDDSYYDLPDDDPYRRLTNTKRIYQGMETAMRIEDDRVVTSRNADVPVREAKILWERMKAGKPVHGEKVGYYTVTSWNGELVIGCHHIKREVVDYFVELYNW